MAGNGVPVLLITANVGSIFEECTKYEGFHRLIRAILSLQPSVMLKIWTEEFLSTISRLDPKFIALHCQEVGGKNYEQSMRHVEDFVRLLMSSEELRLFDKIRVFLDEDYSSAEHFTALGNFYFVHESLSDVLLWDFNECTFVPVSGKEVHSGNIEAVTTKEKAKFPQEFFPECKWSRKGFLRTRWSISGTVFDLINIHLFHDASNFIAMETFPSVYSKTRRRALEHTLDRFHNDKYPNVPYFLFGDFNFRTDTASVIKKLTEDTQERKLSNKGNISKLQFHNRDDDLILTLGKKEFSHYEHQNVFMKNGGEWLREYDKELGDFEGRLFEFPISFVPSYPFQEDINEPVNYMQTRVPAWCDRVLLSPTAKTLVQDIDDSEAVEYGIIGSTTCMGDHKPVYLKANLISDAGMIGCCYLPIAPEFCFRVPNSYLELLSMLPDCNSYANARVIDRSSNLLHAIPVKHDPYTPDSMDSPSPNALTASGEVPDPFIDHIGSDNATSIPRSTQTSNASRRHIDRAVSPALLKSRLELIVQNKNEDSDLEVVSDIKRSPSECHLRSWPDADDQQWCVRKNRCNSDVSWQRSHVLTEAWIQSKGQQGYHSFSNFANRSSSNSSPPDIVDGLPPDLIIPRIAIINASNFESNASSVYFHDDRLSNYSENKLSTYSDGRTKTLSGEAVSSEKSDEICDKTDEEEGNRLSLSTDRIRTEILLENPPSSQALRRRRDKTDTNPNRINVEINDTPYQRTGTEIKPQTSSSPPQYIEGHLLDLLKTSWMCRGPRESLENHLYYLRNQDCDSHVIKVCPDIQAVSHDAEIINCESKPCTSKNSTKTNSTHSQDNINISDHAENLRVKLKAYRATKRYKIRKNNISGKRTRLYEWSLKESHIAKNKTFCVFIAVDVLK
ncbi:Type I inositol-1,4,5-trisphosphate 5-phosphatase [Temnothorax longispinosus]|uniref:inositol-polyphosphate 5-phosphatase n=1 Tax=Temnothorax longispinosus TaxID=300112 RepID=A0A4S2KKY2_9HYME|nr:Type I inositol-1,4,5-trisphosphate 5-phosphatase [Temnothorax longispinosus]